MKRLTYWLFFFASLFAAGTASAGDYSGSYRGDGISLNVQRGKGAAYKGRAEFEGHSCAFSAEYHAEVGGLPPGYDAPILGKMRCGADETKFSANLLDNGNTLELQIESKFYTLRRAVAPGPGKASDQHSAGRRAVARFVLEQVLVADGGNAYFGRLPQGTSARAGLQWVVPQIAGGFDATVVGDGATIDQTDSQAQLLFHTTESKTPIRGLVLAVRDAHGVGVGLVYQNVGKAAEGLNDALAAILARFPKQQGEAEKFQKAVFADGSGSLMLPAGWRIVDSREGAVNASGPDGAFVDLGAHRIVLDPRLLPTIAPGMLAGAYCHPADSLSILFPALTAMNVQLGDPTQLRLVQVIEYVDTQSPSAQVGGQWALVYYEWQRNGQPYQSIGLIGTLPMSVNWGHYWSAVSAPKQVFARKLRTLMRIWGSYYVSDQSVARRLQGALENMRVAGEIYRKGAQDAAQGGDRMAETWKQVIRDQTVVEGPDGWRYETKLSKLDDFLLANPGFQRVPVEKILGQE